MSKRSNDYGVPFIERHEGLVWKISRSFTHTEADCQDLAQEIFVSLWTARDKIRPDSKESTFVYRVAFNRAVSWQRKEHTYLKHLKSFFATHTRSEQRAPTDDARSELDVLYQAMRTLGELDRSLMLLYLDKASYIEMANVVGLSEAAIGKRLSRAKQQLRQSILLQEVERES